MRTEIPMAVCAADGEERTAGITDSRSPKLKKRTAGRSFIMFPLAQCALPLRRQRHSGRNLLNKVRRGIVHNQTFGRKNISLRSNTAGWSVLLGEKLFAISAGWIKFCQFSGNKIYKIQDYPVIRERTCKRATDFSGLLRTENCLVSSPASTAQCARQSACDRRNLLPRRASG